MELIGVERIGEGSAKVPVTGCIAMGLATGVASLVLGMKGGILKTFFGRRRTFPAGMSLRGFKNSLTRGGAGGDGGRVGRADWCRWATRTHLTLTRPPRSTQLSSRALRRPWYHQARCGCVRDDSLA